MHPLSSAQRSSPVLVIAIFTVAGIVWPASRIFAAQSPDLKGPILDRLERLRSVSVELHTVLTYLQNPQSTEQSPLEGSWGYLLSFRFLDGRAVYDWRYDEPTAPKARQKLGKGDAYRCLTVFSHERAESLVQRFNDPVGGGVIA